MRCRLSLIVLCAVVLFAHTIQGQSLITPGSMPSADRIFSEIKGKDPMDTAARQMGAFWHLRQVVETLAGQRRFSNQLTAEERGLLGAYGAGYQKAGAPYAKLMGTAEQPKWYQMHAFYEADDSFRDEVLERFVTPAIRDAYLRAKGIQLKQAVARGEAAQRERERVQAELKAGGPGSAASAATNPQREEETLKVVVDTLLKGAAELAKTREAGSSTEVRASSPNNRTAVAPAPGTPEHFLNEANKHFAAKEYSKAIDSAKKALELKPSLGEAHFTVGSSLYFLEKYKEALPFLKEAVRLNPADADHLHLLGLNYHRLRDFRAALSTLQQEERQRPNNPYVHQWLGNVYAYGLDNLDAAVSAYRRAIALKPDHARVHEELSRALVHLGEVDDALKSAQEAVRLDPKDDGNRVTLAWVYLNTGRTEDAVRIQRALEKAGSKKTKELGEYLDLYFAESSADPDSLHDLAIAMRQTGLTLEPLATYRRILLQSKDPEQRADVHRAMGEIYAEEKNGAKARPSYEAALQEYQLAIRANPQDADLKWMLGRCYLELGRRDEALNVYKRLLPVDKDKAQKLLDEINKKK